MPQLIDKIIELEEEINKQHSAKIKKKPKIGNGLKIGIISSFVIGLLAFFSYLYSTKPVDIEQKAKRKAGEVYNITLNRYRNILKYGITSEERKELPTLLEPLGDVYDGLDIDEKNKAEIDGLKARINDSIKLYDNRTNAEQLYAEALSLQKKGQYSEANKAANEALGLFPEDNNYKLIAKKIETSLAKLKGDDEKFSQIKFKFDQILEGDISIDERKEIGDLLASLSNIYGGLIIDEGKIKNSQQLKDDIRVVIKSYDGGKKRRDLFYSRFGEIKKDADNKNYATIESRIRGLANELEKERFPGAKALLGELKEYSYNKLEYVPAEYKEEDRKILKGWGSILALGSSIITKPVDGITGSHTSETVEDFLSDGSYKERKVVREAYYKEAQVFPYLGKEVVIRDKIPVKQNASTH